MGAENFVELDLPEHGALELPLAGIGRRMIAASIDVLAMLGVAAVWGLVSVALSLGELATYGLFALSVLLPVALPLGFEFVWRGQSPGKRLLDVRVLSRDGTPARPGQLFLRNILRAVDFLPFGYFVGLVAVFASARGQRLGDLVAGTLVVREDPEALRELGAPARDLGHNHELRGVPEALLRGAERLIDPTRALPPELRAEREAEIAGLVRRYRPDLATESDAAIWARLRRVVGDEP